MYGYLPLSINLDGLLQQRLSDDLSLPLVDYTRTAGGSSEYPNIYIAV